MNQLRLFPPPAAPKQPLPDKVRREARNLIAELLMVVIVVAAKKKQSEEEEIDE